MLKLLIAILLISTFYEGIKVELKINFIIMSYLAIIEVF